MLTITTLGIVALLSTAYSLKVMLELDSALRNAEIRYIVSKGKKVTLDTPRALGYTKEVEITVIDNDTIVIEGIVYKVHQGIQDTE
jgi:hypothetical protein